ncbi:hypothetical protein QYM36_013846 [Artemia franciscana]|uniref:Endonuclease/exonuclease/phosphatase domain-containing protein n=1 Tax=Artemia franciscana TaxID=6661 RepID=A0AA88HRT5_ARTSF|nr:hypothetical protein QYM36_013846 [Artemia franciscana]
MIKINSLVIIDVPLPTDYGDERSKQKFALVCKKIDREQRKQQTAGHQVMIIGDFNCNFEDKLSPRSEVLIGVIPDTYNLLKKDRPYSFITVVQNVSNLDHVLHSQDCSNITVPVGAEGLYSEHLPLSFLHPTSNSHSKNLTANGDYITIGIMLTRNYIKVVAMRSFKK